MHVILLPEVLEYLENLAVTLYEKGYFSFEETALKYITGLYDDIITTLPTRLHKPAPKYFDKYGKNMKYAVFKKSRNTLWYVFFKTYEKNGEKFFLIRYIGNNYTVAQHIYN